MPFYAAQLYVAYEDHQASQTAAHTQADAANHATEVQQQQYAQNVANQQPWMDTGKLALSDLSGMMGLGANGQIDMNAPLNKPFTMADFKADPGYQFNLEQGQKAIDQEAAARGMYYSPATLKELANYTQGNASNEFSNAYNRYNASLNNIYSRLSGIAGVGQTAGAQVGTMGANTANHIGENIIGAGNAMAAGQMGSNSAIVGGISNMYNNYMMQQSLQKNQDSSVQSTPQTYNT